MEPDEFSNGLSEDDFKEMMRINREISRLKKELEALGRHRSYSLVITKLDEAQHWLKDRGRRSAQ